MDGLDSVKIECQPNRPHATGPHWPDRRNGITIDPVISVAIHLHIIPLPSSYHHRESCFALLITRADGGRRLVLACCMPQVQSKNTAVAVTAPRSFQLDSAARLPLCVAMHKRSMSSYAKLLWAIMGEHEGSTGRGAPRRQKPRSNDPQPPSRQRGYSIRCGCGVGSSCYYPRESQVCKHTARPLDRDGRRVTRQVEARIRQPAGCVGYPPVQDIF